MPTLMRLIALVLLAALPQFASAYPTRPVRMITPFPPGGASDNGRAVAQPLSEMWGQNVVIDNRGGKKPGRQLHAADGRNAGVVIAPNVYTFVIATFAGFANVDQNMVR